MESNDGAPRETDSAPNASAPTDPSDYSAYQDQIADSVNPAIVLECAHLTGRGARYGQSRTPWRWRNATYTGASLMGFSIGSHYEKIALAIVPSLSSVWTNSLAARARLLGCVIHDRNARRMGQLT